MIVLDTALLKELASVSAAANDAIDDAVGALSRVSTHNDWGCREKYAINEYAVTNRSKIQQIQQNSGTLFNMLTQTANEFEEMEKNIASWFPLVESLISGIVGIPTTVVTAPHNIPHISGIVGDALQKHAGCTVQDPITVCTFADIDLKG